VGVGKKFDRKGLRGGQGSIRGKGHDFMGLRGEWLGNRNSAQGRESGQARDSFGKHRTE
jgi:hypothetical protein